MDALMKTCPDCAEDVRAEARKCRFCGYGFDGPAGDVPTVVIDVDVEPEDVRTPQSRAILEPAPTDELPGVPRQLVRMKSGSVMEVALVNDVREGPYTIYYDDGSVAEQGQYIGGRLSGVVQKFAENGQLVMELPYVDDVIHGLRHRWYPTGECFSDDSYERGKLNGPCIGRYPSGAPRYEETYANGKLVKIRSWNEDGVLVKDDQAKTYFERTLYGMAYRQIRPRR